MNDFLPPRFIPEQHADNSPPTVTTGIAFCRGDCFSFVQYGTREYRSAVRKQARARVGQRGFFPSRPDGLVLVKNHADSRERGSEFAS